MGVIYWNSSSERRRAFSLFLVFLVVMFPVLMALFPAVVSPMSTRLVEDAGAAARTTPLGTTGGRAGAWKIIIKLSIKGGWRLEGSQTQHEKKKSQTDDPKHKTYQFGWSYK